MSKTADINLVNTRNSFTCHIEQRFHRCHRVERLLSSVNRTALLISFPFRQLISVSILFSVNDFIELYQSDSDAIVTSMRVALHSVRPTILSQLCGVKESAIPCAMQNYSKY
jgi:hypothetical protein